MLALLFVGLVVAGLAMWFTGANMPESDDVRVVFARIISRPLALAGAAVIIAAMIVFIPFARWLSRHASGARFARAGTTIMAAGAICHLLENSLIFALFAADGAGAQPLWTAIRLLSFSAFLLLGLGAVILSIGMLPLWTRILGIVVGVLGVLSGVGGIGIVTGLLAPGNPLEVLAPPFSILLLVWLIVLGVRGSRVAGGVKQGVRAPRRAHAAAERLGSDG